ncbi:armadillo repeat-containing protein 6 homolog [Coccinella septempunctata]|uniref:armadillo repeat-containing protein 6 homolog n=1 Tax=Coccinella septempunctata TaxID=41139 RepID=UPI001D0897C4|nr:armadillo repeat-containing protein 6 homolog [Coccinella septempunctata]
MVRIISQETFNDAVRENVDVLGMTFEEALEETIKQFEAQSVDLSNISKEVMCEPINEKLVIDVIKKMEEFNKEKNHNDDTINTLNLLKEYCDKGIEYKVLAGKHGAYPQILTTLENCEDDKSLKLLCLKTMNALMTKQPDLLDNKGVEIILENLEPNTDSEIINVCLKWAKECCIYHEMNRQMLFNANILSKLKIMLEGASNDMLRNILSLFRALVLDDDVRVEFGKAHDHAKGIACETLPILTDLIKKYRTDENVVSDLILTISTLLVRHEFCKQVTEVGALDSIQQVMTEFSQSEKINRQCFKLLKALAGNDDCKVQIVSKGIAPLISSALNNIKSAAIASAGLGCIAALCLRCPENSKVMFESGIPEVIIQNMKNFPNERSVQKTGSWAIRNMVSRSKYQCSHFIELGAEEILKAAFEKFKECNYDVKAALRDLGCEVQLKEEWTGKGGLLNHPQC